MDVIGFAATEGARLLRMESAMEGSQMIDQPSGMACVHCREVDHTNTDRTSGYQLASGRLHLMRRSV